MDKREYLNRLNLRTENNIALEGYALRFNEIADIGFYDEKVSDQVQLNFSDRCYLLRDHDPKRLLGKRGMGFEISKDEKGILFSLQKFPDTELARETKTLVKDGILDGVSLGFYMEKSHFEETENNKVLVVDQMRIVEVSLVPFPAYQSSQVSARSKPKTKTIYPPELY